MCEPFPFPSRCGPFSALCPHGGSLCAQTTAANHIREDPDGGLGPKIELPCTNRYNSYNCRKNKLEKVGTNDLIEVLGRKWIPRVLKPASILKRPCVTAT